MGTPFGAGGRRPERRAKEGIAARPDAGALPAAETVIPGARRIDRATIARSALELIDRDGLEALSMRRVAAELRIDPMSLYRYVPNRDGMVSDIVGLLFAEIDASERPGEHWDETLMRMHRSEREMALRHPHAYALLVLAPRDEEPALGFAGRLKDILLRGGLPEERFLDVWLVDASFTNGFLLLETATLTRASRAQAAAGKAASPASPARVPEAELAGALAETASGKAYVRGLELIYRGFRETIAAPRA